MKMYCKNCGEPLKKQSDFYQYEVGYKSCNVCNHLNGEYQDTDEFCEQLYSSDEGREYAKNYDADDLHAWESRRDDVYFPKAQFLQAIVGSTELSKCSIADLGSGTGYFLGALSQMGLKKISGYEVSSAQVKLANKMIGRDVCFEIGSADVVSLIQELDCEIISMIGVLEHLKNPRSALRAVANNPAIKYMYLSVPLFSVTVFFELLSSVVMTRHLIAGHTHLYTEMSIDYFCEEHKFKKMGEWWFGLDMQDLYRYLSIMLQKQEKCDQDFLSFALSEKFLSVLNDLQLVLDRNHLSSEVHIVLDVSSQKS